jgi:peptidoglycan-associated lipoprotein
MKHDRVGLQISMVLISLGMILMAAGCAGKRSGSASGDESLAEREKGGAVESVKQDRVASVETPIAESDLPSQQGARGGGRLAPSTPGGESAMAGKGSALPMNGAGVGDVFFDFDQYAIRKDARPVLDGNAKWLRGEPGKSVLIEGHCDERGTLAYNLVLGEKRARATKRYLEDLGIPVSRMQTTSYGEVRPFCKDHNEGCWQQNRRAHFVLQ